MERKLWEMDIHRLGVEGDMGGTLLFSRIFYYRYTILHLPLARALVLMRLVTRPRTC